MASEWSYKRTRIRTIGVNFSDFPIKGKEGVSEFEFTE